MQRKHSPSKSGLSNFASNMDIDIHQGCTLICGAISVAFKRRFELVSWLVLIFTSRHRQKKREIATGKFQLRKKKCSNSTATHYISFTRRISSEMNGDGYQTTCLLLLCTFVICQLRLLSMDSSLCLNRVIVIQCTT